MRVVVNTTFAITASVVTAFGTSSLYGSGHFDFEDVLNATLAGGVIVGSTSDMMKEAWGVFLLGAMGGCISVVGYHSIAPKLANIFHDTCGVHNLHGMPGFLGGVTGAIFAYSLPDEGIESIFGARLKGRTSVEQGNM